MASPFWRPAFSRGEPKDLETMLLWRAQADARLLGSVLEEELLPELPSVRSWRSGVVHEWQWCSTARGSSPEGGMSSIVRRHMLAFRGAAAQPALRLPASAVPVQEEDLLHGVLESRQDMRSVREPLSRLPKRE